MALTFQSGSATMTSTEFFLASGSTSQTPQTADFTMQALVDVSAMAAGDRYQLTVYEKINGGSQLPVYQSILDGAQPTPWVSPPLMVGDGWEVGIKKIAGTDRAMGYSLREDDTGTTAAAAAAAVFATVFEGLAWSTWITRLVRFFHGKRSGYSQASPRTVKIRDVADTKDAITITSTDDGWTGVSYND